MTEQEAKEILTLNDEMQRKLPNLKGVYEIAVKALEKQIPKKPVEYEDKYYGCPNCNNPLLHKWRKYNTELEDKNNGLPYCLNCGQSIDWSDKE